MPSQAALCRGELPLRETALTPAPPCMSFRTTSTLPRWEARCSGVIMSLLSCGSISARKRIKAETTAVAPSRAAMCSGTESLRWRWLRLALAFNNARAISPLLLKATDARGVKLPHMSGFALAASRSLTIPAYPFSAAISSAVRPARPLASAWAFASRSSFRQETAPFSAAWLSIIGSRTLAGVWASRTWRLLQWSKQHAYILAMRTFPRSTELSSSATRRASTSSAATARSIGASCGSRSKTRSEPFQTWPSTGMLNLRTSCQTCRGMAMDGVKFTVSRTPWLSQKSQQK
mmetsp:Transcript_25330/g.57614  ORF Transcript_25330/g.57614 Transcript_25330/m.57614 type:complete len:291 (+) Transcript_25330:278-1150(+)